jgi:hypothetical protein
MIPVIMWHGYDEKLAESLSAMGCEVEDDGRSFKWLGTLDEFAEKYGRSFQVYITAFGAKRLFVTQHADFRAQ